MASETVRFHALGEGAPLLEGELWVPGGEECVGGVVVAHPHPLRGGSMHNNVVHALCEGLNRAGIASVLAAHPQCAWALAEGLLASLRKQGFDYGAPDGAHGRGN